MNNAETIQEIYVNRSPVEAPTGKLQTVDELLKQIEALFKESARDAGEAMMMASYEVQSLLAKMGDESDEAKMIADYPALAGVI